MKAVKVIFRCVLILVCIIVLNSLVSTLEMSKKRITAIVKFNHPSCEIVSLIPEYVDWSSSVRPANEDHRATRATVVIRKDEEQRTIHFIKTFGIWIITDDAPDYGKNVPDDEYFMEHGWADIGQKVDIDEVVNKSWVIPLENGELYRKEGGEDWYYSYHYIVEMYRTQNGRIYEFNKGTFEWVPTEKNYSDLDYLGNYKRISKDEAESLINNYKNK